MLKNFKAFCGKPVTWGSYFKFCGICFVAGAVVYGAMIAKIMHDLHKRAEEWKKETEQFEP